MTVRERKKEKEKKFPKVNLAAKNISSITTRQSWTNYLEYRYMNVYEQTAFNQQFHFSSDKKLQREYAAWKQLHKQKLTIQLKHENISFWRKWSERNKHEEISRRENYIIVSFVK